MNNVIIPEIIFKLKQIDDHYSEKFGLETLGFHIDLESADYDLTPPDLISFAWTGGDGIHFGFLTDFSELKDLTQAYIVCVSPTNDPPIKIVARNINEFLIIVCQLKDAEALDDLDFDIPEKEWLTEIELELDENNEDFNNTMQMIQILKSEFNLKEMSSIYDYIEEVRLERAKSISLTSLDGLGVLRTDKSNKNTVPKFDFTNKAENNIKKMKSFINKATYDQKLVFCRDAQFSFILSPDYDHDIQKFVAEILFDIGLENESNIILSVK